MDSVTRPAFISVVIATRDRYEHVARAIDSVLGQGLDEKEFEIIVVDNTPAPRADRQLALRYADFDRMSVISCPEGGLSRARNLGVSEAAGELVAFIDDDAVARKDWLEQILFAFRKFEHQVGVIGGKVDPIWPESQPSWMNAHLLGYFSVVNWGGSLRIADDWEWFAGCNIAFPKQCILAAGGFDETLGRSGNGVALVSNEEFALSDRIVRTGRVRVYAPNAVVSHSINPDRLRPEWLRRRIAWQAVSDFLMDPEKTGACAAEAARRARSALARGCTRVLIERLVGRRRDSEAEDLLHIYDTVVALLAGHDIKRE
jgi:glycosyltransferase involved in cell wall biosynthesis